MAVEVEGVVEGGMRAEYALEDSPPVQSWARQDASEACGRIIAPIGSSCAARSIEVSEMTGYGARPSPLFPLPWAHAGVAYLSDRWVVA